MQRHVNIIGVRFTDMVFDAATDMLARAVTGSRKLSVFFANAATLNIAAGDADYRRTLNAADLVFADGTGVRWASRLRGLRLHANLNGTDFVPALIRRVPGLRVYLLGAEEEVVGKAASSFPALFPEAELVGWRDGYFDHAQPDEVIAAINASRPDLVLVGFGNPLQERFIERNRARIDAPLVAGVGGLFGFWAGSRRRAPSAWRRAGMEWLHILMTERGKTQRYLMGNPAFLVRMLLWLPHDCMMQ